MTEESKVAAIAKEAKAGLAGEGIKRDNAGAAAAKSDSPVEAPTVREIFALPDKGAAPSDEGWKAFRDKLSEEAKGVKWTAAMPDLAEKICEVLEISIPNIFVAE